MTKIFTATHEELGTITTNHSMNADEILELLGLVYVNSPYQNDVCGWYSLDNVEVENDGEKIDLSNDMTAIIDGERVKCSVSGDPVCWDTDELEIVEC